MKFLKFLFFLFIIGLQITCTSEGDLKLSEPDGTQIGNGEDLHGVFEDDWTYSVFPKDSEDFDTATFRLWIPENQENIKAVLVLLPIHNGTSTGLFNDVNWRKFASENKLALLAATFYSSRDTPGIYSEASSGSGRALNEAFQKMIVHNRLPTLKNLAFLMRGYEIGGSFCISYAENYSENVVAVGSIRGGSSINSADTNLNIPVLTVIGEFDRRIESVKNSIFDKRSKNGLWALAVDLNQDQSLPLILPDLLIRSFFRSVLKYRIDIETNDLKPITEDQGWLGNNDDYSIFPKLDFGADPKKASWLIDQDFANDWKAFHER